jgi:hypothetical protein
MKTKYLLTAAMLGTLLKISNDIHFSKFGLECRFFGKDCELGKMEIMDMLDANS